MPKKRKPTRQQLVDLDQIGNAVGLTKRSMEHYLDRMPAPATGRRRGRVTRWDWAVVRPWLLQEFGAGIRLPERYPEFGEEET